MSGFRQAARFQDLLQPPITIPCIDSTNGKPTSGYWNQTQQQRRLEFIERLSSDVPTYPVTLDIARLAGRIEGQQQAIGHPIRV